MEYSNSPFMQDESLRWVREIQQLEIELGVLRDRNRLLRKEVEQFHDKLPNDPEHSIHEASDLLLLTQSEYIKQICTLLEQLRESDKEHERICSVRKEKLEGLKSSMQEAADLLRKSIAL